MTRRLGRTRRVGRLAREVVIHGGGGLCMRARRSRRWCVLDVFGGVADEADGGRMGLSRVFGG